MIRSTLIESVLSAQHFLGYRLKPTARESVPPPANGCPTLQHVGCLLHPLYIEPGLIPYSAGVHPLECGSNSVSVSAYSMKCEL